MKKNDRFMYGLGAVRFKGKELGYIGKDSFDMGGGKPEAAKIEAEQVPGAPVLVIAQSNGTIAPKFDMIQLDYVNLQALLGGALVKTGSAPNEKVTGWTAPSKAMVIAGPVEIALVSGQSILIPNATLLCNPGGKLTLKETAKIECQLEVAAPEGKGVPPYGVFDSDALPAEWSDAKGWTLPIPADEAEGGGA